MIISLVAFLFAIIITLVCVPFAKQLAVKCQLVDLPDKKRKLHGTPIPLIGGITIFVSVVLTLGFTFGVFNDQLSLKSPHPHDTPEASADDAQKDSQESAEKSIAAETQEDSEKSAESLSTRQIHRRGNLKRMIGLFIACGFILLVGVCDDRFEIRGRQKLLGQIIAATILIVFGFRFEQISFWGTTIELSVFSVIVVYAWLLVGINSVNLLDGADGFATTIGLIMCVALCVISLRMGRIENAVIAAAAAGALIGFLRFNFPPASAYLGDAGSMLIGLFISAMAIHCSSKEAAAYFFAPIALLAIPMFDTVAAIVRRQLTGRSIYTVDRGHLHHALLRKGFGPRKALLLFFGMCLMTATGATLAIIYEQSEYAIMSIMAVIIFLVVGRVFGLAEFKLVINKTNTLMRSFIFLPQHRNSHQVSVRLQGERDWDLCWQVLREFAEKSDLVQLTMDLNLPWIHESFHAKFQQTDRHLAPEEQWTAELPLLVNDRIIGRIDLVGGVGESTFYDTIGELADVLSSLQPYFIQTMGVQTVSIYHDAVGKEKPELEVSTKTKARALDIG